MRWMGGSMRSTSTITKSKPTKNPKKKKKLAIALFLMSRDYLHTFHFDDGVLSTCDGWVDRCDPLPPSQNQNQPKPPKKKLAIALFLMSRDYLHTFHFDDGILSKNDHPIEIYKTKKKHFGQKCASLRSVANRVHIRDGWRGAIAYGC